MKLIPSVVIELGFGLIRFDLNFFLFDCLWHIRWSSVSDFIGRMESLMNGK
jgi:hypothetical protein